MFSSSWCGIKQD